MKITESRLRRIIRNAIKESYEKIGDRAFRLNKSRNQPVTLPETLEAIEIIKSHGGDYTTSVFVAGDAHSDEHRETIVGRAGDAVYMVTVTPDSFRAQIHEGDKAFEKAELPGQKNMVNPNDFFAQGGDYECSSLEEFDEILAQAAEDYAKPMRSRNRRSGARKAGWEHFRTK